MILVLLYSGAKARACDYKGKQFMTIYGFLSKSYETVIYLYYVSISDKGWVPALKRRVFSWRLNESWVGICLRVRGSWFQVEGPAEVKAR